MTIEQLKKSLQVIIKNMLDPMVALNIKNTLIYILYRLNEEISANKNLKKIDHQLEIFEILVVLYKEFRFQLRNAVNEINQQKSENGPQKSNIKWMNDIEQRNLPLKDLFSLEDTCLLDTSVQINQYGINNQGSDQK